MRKFVVERAMPGFGNASNQDFRTVAIKSSEAIAQLGGAVQWVHSYVAGDRTFCIFLAEDESAIHRHSEMTGAPVTSICEVKRIIDPTTAAAVARLRT